MKKSIIIIFCLMVSYVNAVVITVNVTTDTVDINPGNGICADTNGNCSLRAAIQEANATVTTDTIYLQRYTTYDLSLISGANDAAFGDLDILDDLTISIINPGIPATSVAELPRIDAHYIDRVIEVSNPIEVILYGLRVYRGDSTGLSASSVGGGILTHSDVISFKLLSSVVSGNIAVTGGGIYSNDQSSVISLSDVSDNMLIAGGTNPDGAGILNKFGEMTIQNSSIHDNILHVNVTGCSMAVQNNNSGENMYVFSSSISDNGFAQKAGATCVGGVYALNSGLYLVNTTIANNAEPGLRFADSPPNNFNLFVRNSILFGNGGSDCGNVNTGIINFGDANGGYNMDSDGSCNLPIIADNLSATDPELDQVNHLFEPGYFLYYEPLPGSPAIDSASTLAVNIGNPNACQQIDQLFRVRPIDGDGDSIAVCDRGAVEYNFDLIFKDGFE